jgi:hypothetical protein
MLCHAASPIAIDLANRMLLQVPNTYALVISTENITQVSCEFHQEPS